MSYNSAIHIGADGRTTKEVAKTIMDILKLPYVDNKTKRLALTTLNKATNISHCTLSNINVQMEKSNDRTR